ncbi:MAG: D-alanyl-D-alanine carboxypeptidase/D-alanyl-D-alanine endopeptidase [Ostreibacterium sp.]
MTMIKPLLFTIRFKLRFFFVLFSLCCFTLSQAALPKKVDEIVKKSGLSIKDISLWVSAIDSDKPLLALNTHIPRSPASVTKAVTTGLGLMMLGANYRWKTQFYIDGSIKNGILQGNLIIKGYGDPYLVQEDLSDMVTELQSLGLYQIDGDVILDNSYYQTGIETPDAFDGKGEEPYNALPNALSINFRTIELVLTPDVGGVVVTTNPKLFYTQVQNNIKLNNSKKCRGAGYRPMVKVDNNQNLIEVSGSISRVCGQRRLLKVLAEAGDLFFGYFKKIWIEKSGKITGKWLYGNVGLHDKLFYQAVSQPLEEQIIAMNKHSNNIMTRQLFLTMGAELIQPPATLKKSRTVVLNYLQDLGIPMQSLVIDNGSGLSRKTRFTAEQLGDFLLLMQKHSAVTLPFENSLSIAGRDGTLSHRLKNTALEGNAIGKTGTLKHAKSLAGYLVAKSGKKYAYVILLAGEKARLGRVMMDGLLLWIYNTQ